MQGVASSGAPCREVFGAFLPGLDIFGYFWASVGSICSSMKGVLGSVALLGTGSLSSLWA